MVKKISVICTALVLFLLASNVSAQSTTLTNGLVGYWKFDSINNLTITDESGAGNTGSVGTSSRLVPGKFGQALKFDLNQKGQHMTINQNFASTQWSISTWINPDRPIPIGSPYHGVLTVFSGSPFLLGISKDGVGAYTQPIASYDFIANTGWRHLVLTYDGVSLKTYVDGVNRGSYATTTNMLGASIKRYIGTNGQNNNGHIFLGSIDETRLYNRVLTPAEITSIFAPTNTQTVTPAAVVTTIVKPVSAIASNVTASTNKSEYVLGDTMTFTAKFTPNPEWFPWLSSQKKTQGEVTFTLRSEDGTTAAVQAKVAYNMTAGEKTVTYNWKIPTNFALSGKTYRLAVDVDNSLTEKVSAPIVTTSIKAMGATVTPTVPSNSLNLQNGLLVHWSFDNVSGTNVPDSSSQNNPGILVNSPSIVAGKFGQAINITTASQGVRASRNFIADEWTISTWINIPPVSTASPYGSLYTLVEGDALSPNAFLTIGRDGVYMYQDRLVNYNFDANPGWRHLIVHYNGSEIITIVDNNIRGTVPYTRNIFANTTATRRVGLRVSATHSFQGKIDDFRFYNRALSTREVAVLFNPNVVVSNDFIAFKSYPPANLPNRTGYTQIVMDLNQRGWCHASTVAGQTYGDMPIAMNTNTDFKVFTSIQNLEPGRTYNYYVKCIDTVGNQSPEIPVTFTVAPDTDDPDIIEVSHSAVREDTAEIVWSTKEPANSRVEYWVQGQTQKTTLNDPVFTYPHAQLLTGLTPNTTYVYTVSSADRAGNRTTSSQRTFKTRGPASRVYYVATNGSDTNPGTLAQPFLTLEKARDTIRGIARPLPAGGVQVYIRGGEYVRPTAFQLTNQDNGTADSPIRYSAYQNETVKITGSREVSNFTRANNSRIKNANVMQASLGSIGITNYGTRQVSGSQIKTVNAPLELFFNGKRMTLARYPNESTDKWAQWLPVGSVQDSRQTFSITNNRPATWASFADIWMTGNWFFDHRHSTLKATSITSANGGYRINAPGDLTGIRAGRPFYFFNIPEELDTPGEYYVDTSTGMLYFYPPSPLANAKAYVSVGGDLVDMNGTQHTIFQGITFENTRGKAFDMDRNTAFNMIENSTIRGTNVGAYIAGKHNGIWGSKIYDINDNGVVMHGGEARTLEGGYNYVNNSEIYNVAKANMSYRSGVNLTGTDTFILTAGPSNGVANRVRYNYFHDMPHYAIVGSGNNFQIDFNVIERACTEVLDCGAIYFNNATVRQGHAIKYNYIKDVTGFDYLRVHAFHAAGIYLDNGQSGTAVYGNIVKDSDLGFLINVGRDNYIENNIITGTDEPFHINAVGYNILIKFYKIAIADISNTTPRIVTTVRPHGSVNLYESNAVNTVEVSGARGATNANGTWSYDIVDDTKLRLRNSTAGGEYTGHGFLTQNPEYYRILDTFNNDAPPYSDFYPRLVNAVTEPDFAEPLGNIYRNNVMYGNTIQNPLNMIVPKNSPNSPTAVNTRKYTNIADPSNQTNVPFSFTNLTTFNLQGLNAGVRSIPFNQIGLLRQSSTPPPPPVNTFTLTTNKVGTGIGAISGTGIDCGNDCAETVTSGTSITLTARPEAGSTFTGWTGACTGTGNCTVSLTTDRTVTAGFTRGNSAPVTAPISFNTNGTALNITLSATDAENDPIVFTTGQQPQRGVVTRISEGRYTYTPNTPHPSTPYTDTFNYNASDGTATSPATRVTITYTPRQYVLTTSKTGNGTISGTGIDCGIDCNESINTGIPITLTAQPIAGNTFTGWSGACTNTTGTCTVTMTQDRNVIANFVITNTAPVAQGASYNTSGTPFNITLTASDAQPDPLKFTPSTPALATLTRVSEGVYRYTMKTPLPAARATDTFTFTANDGRLTSAAATVSVVFTPTPPTQFSLNTATIGSGSISGTGISCGQDCTERVNTGTSITLTATPTQGYSFAGWTGACTNTAGTCTVLVNADKSATARFNIIPPADGDADGVPDTADRCRQTPASKRTQVNAVGCVRPVMTRFNIKPNVEGDITNINNVEIGIANVGKIKFNQPVVLGTADNALDLDTNVIIEQDKVEIKSSVVPELNKNSTITLYNISETNPRILKDGVVCLAPNCIIDSFVNGTLTFTVTGFSVYTVEETPVVTTPQPQEEETPRRRSGGGGGGSSRITTPSTAPDTATLIAELTNQLNMLIAQLNALTGRATPVTPAIPGKFNVTLALGSRHPDVVRLQRKLNELGISVPTTGYYGPQTVAAVKKLQAKHGIKQTGTAGAQIRAVLNR